MLNFGWLNHVEFLCRLIKIDILVCGLEHLDYFSHHIGNVIIPTDEVHHFSEGWRKTTNQI